MQFGLLGEKLGYSLSPQIHQHLFELLQIKNTYDLLEIKHVDLSNCAQLLKEQYNGINVTIPYKLEIMQFLDVISPEAEKIGAVNTIHFEKNRVTGYNTDYFGFGRSLLYRNISISGKKTVVLGTGGASRAVIQYLRDHNAESITVVSRCPRQCDTNKNINEFLQGNNVELINYQELSRRDGGYLLVNCTPVGMDLYKENSPVTAEVAGNYEVLVDLIYNPAETLFLKYWRQQNRIVENGLYMLVAQAVAAEEIWLGRTISEQVITMIAKKMGATI